MADYNIYIHSMDGEGGGASQNGTPTFNPTAPWGSQESGGGGSDSQQLSKQTPNFMADAKQTASLLMKKMPWLAAAYAVVKTAYDIQKTAAEFSAIETGNFNFVNAISNYEAKKNIIFHPVSYTIQTLKTIKLNQIENQRKEMQRSLLGDSEINRYSNRGY